MVAGRALKKQEPLSPVREFLGYGIFVAVIVCLMLGFSSWKVTLIGAIAVVFSGVLTEREAIDNMNMSTVLLYVGVTVLGEGLSQTGAAEMLGNWIANVLSGVSNGLLHRGLHHDLSAVQPCGDHRAGSPHRDHLRLHGLRPPRPHHPVRPGFHVLSDYPAVHGGGSHGHERRRLQRKDSV